MSSVDGRSALAYDAAGSGEAILLLHASAGDRRMWDPQWPGLLDSGRCLVRCDFRGYGQSPVPTETGSDAEDVVDLLDALGVRKAAVVGASFGGGVALEIAARWPERIHALVLLCTVSPFHPPTGELNTFDEQEEALLEAGRLHEAVELNVRTWLGPEADASARDLVRRMQRQSYEVQLAAPEVAPVTAEFELSRVWARTLVVTGQQDMGYFRRAGEELAARLTDATWVDLAWAGHLPNLERPEQILALLVEFLDSDGPE
ncbi:alpha/beta hydrolase [Citricoccus alkalitolerans]|uniref:Alpha/beta fold hydrolase n=1 Tax=Citricoccus alkalitolerans TaxID=246603 RepID=A0ABV8XYI5_9MICC